MWAIPGGFKRPDETLDEAAKRELSEETGVDVPSLLTQFGAYGDPGTRPAHERRHGRVPRRAARRRRDRRRHRRSRRRARPRLGHPRRRGSSSRSTTCGSSATRSSASGVELEVSGIATAFVGTTFTMAELRAVYEAIWGVQLDAANFRRSLVARGRVGRPDRPHGSPGPGRRQARRALPRRPRVEATAYRSSDCSEPMRAREFHDGTGRRRSCGSATSSGPCRRRTRCSSGSTRRPSTRDAMGVRDAD